MQIQQVSICMTVSALLIYINSAELWQFGDCLSEQAVVSYPSSRLSITVLSNRSVICRYGVFSSSPHFVTAIDKHPRVHNFATTSRRWHCTVTAASIVHSPLHFCAEHARA